VTSTRPGGDYSAPADPAKQLDSHQRKKKAPRLSTAAL
jgi:hypothetical protein